MEAEAEAAPLELSFGMSSLVNLSRCERKGNFPSRWEGTEQRKSRDFKFCVIFYEGGSL